MKATKEGKLIKTTGDILGNPKVQKTIKSMVKSLLPITERTQYCIVDCGKEICQCKPTNKIQMNKEKTAMQMLIEAMQRDYDSIDGSETPFRIIQKSEIGLRILQAKSLLQKEQEQIEKAFDDGYKEGTTPTVWEKDRESGKQYSYNYYQSKYGGENEN